MPDYDPKVIRKFSDQMYFSSEIIRVILPVAGVLIGGVIGYGLFKMTGTKLLGAAVGGAGAGYLGMRMGDVKATQFKSDAQMAMCLAAIEENTRPRQTDSTTAS